MPELPEVETVATTLHSAVAGRRINRLELLDPRLDDTLTSTLKQKRIEQILRVGKQVVWALCSPRRRKPDLYLSVHLRMTGRLIVSRTPERQVKHVRANFFLDEGIVQFVDPRRFGTITTATSLDDLTPAGLDPTSDLFTQEALAHLLQGSRSEIKPWLLRQNRLVGIGNIYASEILFDAHLAPTRLSNSLNSGEIKRLWRSTKRVLGKAIAHCGTTFSDFQNAEGSPGGFGRFLKVYGREHQLCRRCKGQISRVAQQQRSTFFCPRCQT